MVENKPTLKDVLNIAIDHDLTLGTRKILRNNEFGRGRTRTVYEPIVEDAYAMKHDFDFISESQLVNNNPAVIEEMGTQHPTLKINDQEDNFFNVYLASFESGGICTFNEIFKLHNIDLQKSFQFHLKKHYEHNNIVKKIDEISEQVKDLYWWDQELNNNSEGYENVHLYDFAQLFENYVNSVSGIIDDPYFMDEISEDLINEYFSYDNSSVLDFSLYRNVRFTYWGFKKLRIFLQRKAKMAISEYYNEMFYKGKNSMEIDKVFEMFEKHNSMESNNDNL